MRVPEEVSRRAEEEASKRPASSALIAKSVRDIAIPFALTLPIDRTTSSRARCVTLRTSTPRHRGRVLRGHGREARSSRELSQGYPLLPHRSRGTPRRGPAHRGRLIAGPRQAGKSRRSEVHRGRVLRAGASSRQQRSNLRHLCFHPGTEGIPLLNQFTTFVLIAIVIRDVGGITLTPARDGVVNSQCTVSLTVVLTV
jgi:hypothetical protein